jgi:hypothetical protein
VLAQARDLQRRNQAAGRGDPQGIDDVVEQLYERVMVLGGLAFGHRFAAARPLPLPRSSYE